MHKGSNDDEYLDSLFMIFVIKHIILNLNEIGQDNFPNYVKNVCNKRPNFAFVHLYCLQFICFLSVHCEASIVTFSPLHPTQ